MSLTVEEWREAFWRLCVIDEWRDLNRPRSAGPDGVDWVPESGKFDPEAAARALLDDDRVRDANEGADHLVRYVLERPV